MAARRAEATPPWGGDAVEQPAATEALRRALTADEVAHAWLVVGPPEVGQEDLVRSLSMALNCPSAPAPDLGCGDCPTCGRIGRGRDELVLRFEPEGLAYVVDNVQTDWVPAAMRSITHGTRRVLSISAADRMNVAAQNAFLKLLEEPPPSVVWVLEAEDESALLDTVRSRCRRLAVVPWSMDGLRRRAAELGVVGEQRIEAVARAALGSPRRLEDLTDPDVADARDRHLGIIDVLATAGPGAVVPVSKQLVAWSKGRSAALEQRHRAELERLDVEFGADARQRGWPPGLRTRVRKRHERLERAEKLRALGHALDDLASYLRDLLAVQAGAASSALINLDQEPALRRDAARLPAQDVVAALVAVRDCQRALARNGNPELQLERTLMLLAVALFRARAA